MAEKRAPKPGEPVPDLLPDPLTLDGARDVAAGCSVADLKKVASALTRATE